MHARHGLLGMGFLAIAAVAQAQAPLHRQGLGGQLMDGVLPFEQVDPLSGNLVVTATDLVLPGNAGFDLRVQRFYNSALYPGYATGDLTIPEDSWAGLGWRLHFGRVFQPDATGSGETRIEMGDGSQHPLYTTSAFSEGWITRDFWLYDRATQTLKLPNGVVYTFGRLVHLNDTLGDVRYVTAIQDVFGNRLDFTYFSAPGPLDGVQRIRQILGASQEREVTFTYNPGLKCLQTMQYGSRIWHYDQVAVDLGGHTPCWPRETPYVAWQQIESPPFATDTRVCGPRPGRRIGRLDAPDEPAEQSHEPERAGDASECSAGAAPSATEFRSRDEISATRALIRDHAWPAVTAGKSHRGSSLCPVPPSLSLSLSRSCGTQSCDLTNFIWRGRHGHSTNA